MSRLDRKLLRDLIRLAPQLATAVLVLTAGLSMLVMAGGLMAGIERARDTFYEQRRMADLAASAVRAPQALALRAAGLAGVLAVEARVSGHATLDLPWRVTTLSARLLSLPDLGTPAVNDLSLRDGRWPEPGRAAEALVSSAFAEANQLGTGTRIPALIKGKRQVIEIVGVADSPEFIFTAPPGEIFPQADRFGVIWLRREGIARALDLDGAFNDLAIRLTPDAKAEPVQAAVDDLLRPYGGQGAYGRDRMISDRFVTEELQQLRTMSVLMPLIFLGVAAFLVNVTLSRLVATERSNIGLLKSFGFSAVSIGWHYAKLALVVGVLGGAGAIGLGLWLGHAMVEVYATVYRFPDLAYRPEPGVLAIAVAVGVGTALAGALGSVRRAVRLAPAVALAPPAPTAFQAIGLDRRLARLNTPSRIIARRILRFPQRAATTVIGLAAAMALLIMSSTFPAATEDMLRVNFDLVNRQTATITFADPRGTDVLSDVARLPGVVAIEPVRIREAVFQNGPRRVRESLTGMNEWQSFGTLRDDRLAPIVLRGDGLTLSRRLADKLGAAVGDRIRIETTDGLRTTRDLPVAAIADTWVGGSAYMEIRAMVRAFQEPERISAVHLALDGTRRGDFDRVVRGMPAILSASFTSDARLSQEAIFAQGVGFLALIFNGFAALMAVGVAFSAARITLAEQERDLATLRVLGFSSRECMGVLIGEMAILAMLAVPVGLLMGWLLSLGLMRAFETDLFTLRLVVVPSDYAFAILFVMAWIAVTAIAVARGVRKVSLTETLKARG